MEDWLIVFLVLFIHTAAFSLVHPVKNAIIAALTPRELGGEIAGIDPSIALIGIVIGATVFGFIADASGLEMVFMAMVGIYWVLIFISVILGKKYEHTIKHVYVHHHHVNITHMHQSHVLRHHHTRR